MAIWEVIAAKRHYSAVSRPFTLEEEQAYIASLSDRGAIFIAELDGRIIGFQSLARWAGYTPSFDHVGEVDTFVAGAKGWKRDSIGRGGR